MIARMRLIRRSGGSTTWELRALVVAIVAVTLGVVVLIGLRVTDALNTPEHCRTDPTSSGIGC
jgi:cytochrome c oxidase subunit IV